MFDQFVTGPSLVKVRSFVFLCGIKLQNTQYTASVETEYLKNG